MLWKMDPERPDDLSVEEVSGIFFGYAIMAWRVAWRIAALFVVLHFIVKFW